MPLKAAVVRREALARLEDLPGWANTVIGDLLSEVSRLDERIAGLLATMACHGSVRAGDRLYAIDMPYPLARDDDAKAQPGRTSTTEAMQFLAQEVDKVRKATGADKVVLVGNSRGGRPHV